MKNAKAPRRAPRGLLLCAALFSAAAVSSSGALAAGAPTTVEGTLENHRGGNLLVPLLSDMATAPLPNVSGEQKLAVLLVNFLDFTNGASSR